MSDWSRQEIDTVRRLAGTMPPSAIADHLLRRRRPVEVYWKLVELGLAEPRYRWTADEINNLRTSIATASVDDLCKILPRRSAYAIRGKITELGLYAGGGQSIGPCYSPAEVAALLDRSYSTVCDWMQKGGLRSVRGADLRKRYVKAGDLFLFLSLWHALSLKNGHESRSAA